MTADSPRLYTLGRYQLAIDPQTGTWLSLTDTRTGDHIFQEGARLSPVLLTVDGTTLSTRGFGQMFTLTDPAIIGLRWTVEHIEAREHRGVVHLAEGDWRVTLEYSAGMGGERLERRVRIAYVGEGQRLLRYFDLRTPWTDLGPPTECLLEAPGYYCRSGQRVCHLPYGRWGRLEPSAFSHALAWRPPLLGMHRAGVGRSLLFWAHTETEPFFPMVERADAGLMFSQRVYLADRFENGHALEWGTQYLQLVDAEWLVALEGLQAFYDEVGLTAPRDIPDWARSLNLYEVHVGSLAGFVAYPDYPPLVADLEQIRDRGFDAVYIMPHVPYPGYSVIDYRNMEIQQGSDAGFRAFVERAHALGMKVMIDVTMHGVMDRRARRLLSEREGAGPRSYPMEPTMPEAHPYLEEHPEWFSRNEQGDIATTYTYAFDHASESWQQFMVDVFRYYVTEYDIDGFRVDSHTWNLFPNWDHDLDRPASASFYASAQLFKRVRAELKQIKPDVVLYTETSGPLIYTSHELGYNYDEHWLLFSSFPVESLHGLRVYQLHGPNVSHDRLTARDIALWLHQLRLALPRGVIKVRHLDCHDTYWQPRQFRRQTFGLALSKALVGLFALQDGGFMDFNGADNGMEDHIAHLIRLRKTHPVLRHGDCDYLAVQTDHEMTLPLLRTWQERCLVPVIHLSDSTAEVTLTLPLGRMGLTSESYQVTDLMTGRAILPSYGERWERADLASLPLTLEPYQVILLEFF